MKIAMLGHKCLPSREGGVEVVVEQLATAMVARGHEVTCFERRRKHQKKEIHDYQGITIRPVWTIDRKGFSAVTSSGSASFLAAIGEYDIVHYHAEGSCIMLWLAKLLGKRCIVTVHGLDHQRAKWGKVAKTCIRMGEQIAAKFADEIIVLSESEKQYFWENYHRKTIFIPNGVNDIEVREADLIRKKYCLKKDDYILFLGRLVPEKGIHYLIKAYQQLHTEKKLVIAGASSDTDAYVHSLRLLAQGNPNIVFTGFVEGRMLEELYSNAYFYVLFSELEGMPLSLMEAMSVGNCCVVSDIEECVAVTEDHAVICKKGEWKDLKKKMQKLCDKPELVQKYRAASAEFICPKYHWNNIVDQTLDVYSTDIES